MKSDGVRASANHDARDRAPAVKLERKDTMQKSTLIYFAQAMLPAALSLSIGAASGWAQASRDDIKALPMPPPAGDIIAEWAVPDKAGGHTFFSPPGQWSYAEPGLPAGDPRQFAYFRFTQVAGKKLKISSNWAIISNNSRDGGTGIPPRGCGHAHHVWGIFVKWKLTDEHVWLWLTTGGKWGRIETPNGPCVVSEEDIPGIGEAFADLFLWGLPDITLWIPEPVSEIIVASQSATHGWGTRWGDCGDFACYDQVMVEVINLYDSID
jgi:hypothetical protein